MKDAKIEDIAVVEQERGDLINEIKIINKVLYLFIVGVSYVFEQKNEDMAAMFMLYACRLLRVIKNVPLISREDAKWSLSGMKEWAIAKEEMVEMKEKYPALFFLVSDFWQNAQKSLTKREMAEMFSAIFWMIKMLERASLRQKKCSN